MIINVSWMFIAITIMNVSLLLSVSIILICSPKWSTLIALTLMEENSSAGGYYLDMFTKVEHLNSSDPKGGKLKLQVGGFLLNLSTCINL